MRKNLYSLWIAAVMITFTACSRNSTTPEPEPGPAAGSVLKMKIDGVPWESSKGTLIGQSYIDGKYNLTIAGMDEDFGAEASSCSIIMSSDTELTTGLYQVDTDEFDGGSSLTKVNGKTYLAHNIPGDDDHCFVEITAISHSGIKGKIHGKFSGPAPSDFIVITDGEFSN